MRLLCFTLVFTLVLGAGWLSDDQQKLLRDPGGWEYLSLSSAGDGFPTEHTCFDGTPHPDECAGRLQLGQDDRFEQTVTIQGKTVRRTGRYELADNSLTFFDEFGTRDGPYTVQLNEQDKTLRLDMAQTHVRLLLESAFREQQRRNGR